MTDCRFLAAAWVRRTAINEKMLQGHSKGIVGTLIQYTWSLVTDRQKSLVRFFLNTPRGAAFSNLHIGKHLVGVHGVFRAGLKAGLGVHIATECGLFVVAIASTGCWLWTLEAPGACTRQ
jgi:hypothetical protein